MTQNPGNKLDPKLNLMVSMFRGFKPILMSLPDDQVIEFLTFTEGFAHYVITGENVTETNEPHNTDSGKSHVDSG